MCCWGILRTSISTMEKSFRRVGYASGNKMKETPSTIVSDIIVGGGLLKSPYYGEDPQSGAAILQGVKYYKKFSNNWFFPDNKSKK